MEDNTTKQNYYQANRERILERRKIWYEKNRDRINEYRRDYYDKNKDRINAIRYAKDKQKREVNREKKEANGEARKITTLQEE